MENSTGSTSPGAGGEELDDPGRDPEGLDPPRDILDAPGGMPEQGSYQPHRSTQPRDTPPDQPPTSTEGSGP